MRPSNKKSPVPTHALVQPEGFLAFSAHDLKTAFFRDIVPRNTKHISI
jgi:hypothetical protein